MRMPGFTADVTIGGSYGYGGSGAAGPWAAQLRPAYRIPFEGVAALPTTFAGAGGAALPGVASLPGMTALPGMAGVPGATGVLGLSPLGGTAVLGAPGVQAVPCLYGRWCGPGCSGPGQPIDNLDRCCQAHDRCYEARGYFACSCDHAFLGCVAPIRSIWTYKGRWAITIWTSFASKVAGGLCNPFA